MNIIATRHIDRSISHYLVGLPPQHRTAFFGNMVKLLTDGFKVKLDRQFYTDEGWIDLANYLVTNIYSKLPADTDLALEFDQKQNPLLTSYENSGAVPFQKKIAISSVVALRKSDPVLSELILSMCGHLAQVKRVATWYAGLFTSDFEIYGLKSLIEDGEHSKAQQIRINKTIADYEKGGIAKVYQSILRKSSTSKKAKKLCLSILNSGKATNDVLAICDQFLKIEESPESLNSIRIDAPPDSEEFDSFHPLPISHSFLLIWKQDEIQEQIDNNIDIQFQEGGLETIYLKSTLVSTNGYSANLKKPPELPHLLSSFFDQTNTIIAKRLKGHGRRLAK
ncbi:MAG: hypothetical protein IM613_17950 [Cytophagales bacterium]|nr:hypothetical protein [Cytophagales bacterium]